MEKRATQILDQWLGGVNAGDIEKLLSLYAGDAVLIPTFSNKLIHTREDLRDYFTRLGAREDLGISLREKTLIIQTLVADHVAAAGIYSWRFKVDGELLNFEARFSYVLDISKPAPIIHHHSSQIPRML